MSSTPTFEEQVNTVVGQMTTGEDGKTVLPEGIEASEEVLYAAKLAKRHRDTQSAFTKAQQRAKVLESENERLASSWEQDATKNLTSVEQARLEELKQQDPDAWREEITNLETTKREQFQTRRKAITTETYEQTELERRQQLLDDYNTANPDLQITDDVIENDIPPRLTKQLKEGKLPFDEFIEACHKYLGTPKVIKGEEAPNEPDFAGARGGGKPSDEAVKAANSSEYQTEIF